MKKKLLFEEEQSFVGTWIFYLVFGTTLLAVGGAVFSIWNTEAPTEAVIAMVITILVTGGIFVLFFTSKLYTCIDEYSIYYRFPPFVNKEKVLTNADVKELYIRKYKPILEYGGWGYRIRLGKGKALNVSGNMGLQLVLKNNKAILIGTQKPEELERALKRLKENWGLHG